MKHNIGIIGYGYMGNWHFKNSQRIDNLGVTCVYDIDSKKLANAKKDGLKTYDNLENFLKDDSFDIVLIATPNDVHKQLAIKAMEFGKNVVCEKPVTMNSLEMEEIIKSTKKYNKHFFVHQNRRWDKDFNIVKSVIEKKQIGKPHTIESRIHGQRGVVFGWRANMQVGGGMFYDWGVHLIDQFLMLVDSKVKDVYCYMANVKTPTADDYFKIILRFENGVCCTGEVGTYCLKQLPRWYVHGDLGCIEIKDWECNGEIIFANQYQVDWEQEVVQTSAGPTRSMAPRPKETLTNIEIPKINPDWCEFYQNVIDTIQGEAEQLVKNEQVLRVCKIIDAGFKSNELASSVKVDI